MFKRTSSENEIFQNIFSLLKYKNFNPSKEEDLKELLSMAIDPATKSINSDEKDNYIEK